MSESAYFTKGSCLTEGAWLTEGAYQIERFCLTRVQYSERPVVVPQTLTLTVEGRCLYQ